MKNIFTILTAIILSSSMWAQVPLKMSYQAIIRNSSNHLVTNHLVGMRISIIKDSITGTAIYVETQIPTTNLNGLVSIEIGGGNVVSGSTANINWAKGPFFIKTETDTTGGTNYSIISTTQLLTVPYAFFSNSSFTAYYSDTAHVADSTLNNGFSNFLVFDSVGTHNFTVPHGIHNIMVEVWGGGGGSASDTFTQSQQTFGCSGGGGGYAKSIFHVQAGDTFNVIVGNGGLGVLYGNGGDGGTSYFGSLIYATGGEGGPLPLSATDPTLSNGGSGHGQLNISGFFGSADSGGNSPNGGSGGKGFAQVYNNTIVNGIAPGGGGANTDFIFYPPGNGAHGRVVIYW